MSAHATDTHGGDVNAKNTLKPGVLYTIIAGIIFAIFTLTALWIVVQEDPAQSNNPSHSHEVRITKNSEINLGDITNGTFVTMRLSPNVTVKCNAIPTDNYYPLMSPRIIMKDDQGNVYPNTRWETPYVTVTNTSNTSNEVIKIARCANAQTPVPDFMDYEKEMKTFGSGSVDGGSTVVNTIGKTAVSLITYVFIVGIIYIVIYVIISFMFPYFWDTPLFTGSTEDDDDDHHDDTHDDDHHEGGNEAKKNGINPSFIFHIGLTLLLGYKTLSILNVYYDLEAWYAIIPGVAFLASNYIVFSFSYKVELNTITGIYNRITEKEIFTAKEGDGWTNKILNRVGSPKGQQSINLDISNMQLDAETAEDAIIWLSDDFFIAVRQPRGFFKPKNGQTAWVQHFRGGTVDDVKEFMKEAYWTAVAIAADEFSIMTVRQTKNRTVNGKEILGLKFSDRIDEILMDLFEANGVHMEGHTTMAQPRPVGDQEKAIQMRQSMKVAMDAVKNTFPNLTEAQREKAARIWGRISTETYQTVGVDKPTIEAFVQSIATVFGKAA